ncbi:MAG: translation initiation factor IF-3 [Solirubrobacteraceae bacterium]
MPEVRLVGEDGKQVGVLKTSEALAYAQERDLDLVEVAPDARPPVCRVLDYSKYKYEQAQKQKQARKHQQQINIREIKFRPKIAQNDYDTKKGHVARFLRGRDRVKVTIMFRGREVTHPERGTALLEKLAEELQEVAVVEQRPIQDGRNMTMMLAPSKAILSGEIGGGGSGDSSNGSGDSGSKPKAPSGESGESGSDAATGESSGETAEPTPGTSRTSGTSDTSGASGASGGDESAASGGDESAASGGDEAAQPESAPADATA